MIFKKGGYMSSYHHHHFNTRYTIIVLAIISLIGCGKKLDVPGISIPLTVGDVQVQVLSAKLDRNMEQTQINRFEVTAIDQTIEGLSIPVQAPIQDGNYTPMRESDTLLIVDIKLKGQIDLNTGVWDKKLTVLDENGREYGLYIRKIPTGTKTVENISSFIFEVSKSARDFTLRLPDGQTVKLGSVLKKN